MTPAAWVDPVDLMTRCLHDGPFAATVLERIPGECRRRLAEISRGADAAAIADGANALKTAAATAACGPLCDAADALERAARDGQDPVPSAKLDALEAAIAATVAAIPEVVTRLGRAAA